MLSVCVSLSLSVCVCACVRAWCVQRSIRPIDAAGVRSQEEGAGCDPRGEGVRGAHGEPLGVCRHTLQRSALNTRLTSDLSQMSQKKKQLKKDGKPIDVEEDDPEVVRVSRDASTL